MSSPWRPPIPKASPLKAQPRKNPPHIRLNSGVDNILSMISDSSDSIRQGSRSLLGGGVLARNKSVYSTKQPAESNELLLPPSRNQRQPLKPYRDTETPQEGASGADSGSSSRRSSWSTECSDDSLESANGSPFDDYRSQSRADSNDGDLNTQTVAERYNISPSAGLLLFPEDVEMDDYMHNPDANDSDRSCEIYSRRGLINITGLVFLMLGVVFLFIGYPMLTFVQDFLNERDVCRGIENCLDVGKVPLLQNVRQGLIDPDTPKSALTRVSSTGKSMELVFSDEFSRPGRTFYEGDDPYWQAVDIWYGVTGDLEWYDPDAVTTANGTLNIRFDAFQNHNLNYRSGMLQSWNQLCYKGGYIEASISLPGRGDTIGFWPGFWTMGNLGRPGYAATTEGMWPYSYEDICDAGITANQSDPSGLSSLPGMRLPACTCTGEDHPSPGRSRSAPEIDALEASVTFLEAPHGNGIGSASQSLQCAPFDVFWQPDYDFVELYDHSITTMNSYQGGVYQQAISGVTNLNNQWYEGKKYQTYGFEYEPGASGHVTWFVGNQKTWMLDGRAMGPNGNVGQRIVPEEPLAMIINFGMSNGFAMLNMSGLGPLMPATMRFDYVRIYQEEGAEMVTCDPPGWETTAYIAKHPMAYHDANLTLWSQTPYEWPKNSLIDGCKAENYLDP